ncbi:MAG: glycosyl hydrolase [Planctomycetota bacterium]
MYASHGFLRSDIGDVDVVYHDGLFHLFHLVLPNHDFIAHATSQDGLNWTRVKNALFVDDPGTWDDDMLWTMHVSPDPDASGEWRMFYTGLSRHELGRVQRIGLARSRDLMDWRRCDAGDYPLEVPGPYYESSIKEGRSWVSFRDPYFFHRDGQRWLLFSGRVKEGPVIRRGCVGLAKEVAPNRFEFAPPLYRPGLYDDVEVPVLFELGGKFFLMGSIREDTKVHYWYADTPEGPYHNYFDNVLLPKGNYAARICKQGNDLLLFNFFAKTETHAGQPIVRKLLPPPKRLVTDATGRLQMKSFGGFDDQVLKAEPIPPVEHWDRLLANPHAQVSCGTPANEGSLSCQSGYEAFLLPGVHEDFRLRATIGMNGDGKCGMVLRTDSQADGYYLSLDLIKGVAQLRAWGENRTHHAFDHAFKYSQLQAGYFISDTKGPWTIEVVAYGVYLEVSIGGYVLLTLADDTFSKGRIGFYAESATLHLEALQLETLDAPRPEATGGTLCSSMAEPLSDDPVITIERPADAASSPVPGTGPLPEQSVRMNPEGFP